MANGNIALPATSEWLRRKREDGLTDDGGE